MAKIHYHDHNFRAGTLAVIQAADAILMILHMNRMYTMEKQEGE